MYVCTYTVFWELLDAFCGAQERYSEAELRKAAAF